MQKGKALHRAPPLNRPTRSWIAAIFVISVLLPGNAPGMNLRGLPPRPRDYIDPFSPIVPDRYALCYSSCQEPYGIEDLRIYRVLVGGRIERFALWSLWDAIDHPLYRLDMIRLRVCLQPFGLPAAIALEPWLRRESVKGFPAAPSAGSAAALLLCRRDVAVLLWKEVVGRGGAGSALISCSVSIERIFLTAACRRREGSFSLVDTSGEISIDRSVSMLTGYRLDTGEIRFGLACRRGRIIVTALWAHHPVLGGTISLGVGCLWRR